MDRPVFQAKDVAHQVKCADLAASVGEELVAPNRAVNDLVDIVGRLGLSVNLGAPGVFELAQDELRARQAALLAEELWPIGRSGGRESRGTRP